MKRTEKQGLLDDHRAVLASMKQRDRDAPLAKLLPLRRAQVRPESHLKSVVNAVQNMRLFGRRLHSMNEVKLTRLLMSLGPIQVASLLLVLKLAVTPERGAQTSLVYSTLQSALI